MVSKEPYLYTLESLCLLGAWVTVDRKEQNQ